MMFFSREQGHPHIFLIGAKGGPLKSLGWPPGGGVGGVVDKIQPRNAAFHLAPTIALRSQNPPTPRVVASLCTS